MTRARPFSFDEFRNAAPKTADSPSPPRAYATEDLAAARAEGVIEGRRIAMETIAADEAAALDRIAGALADAVAAAERRSHEAREGAIAVARLFLDEYCATLASEREIDVAQDLLRRLTENSEDRRAATLVVSAKSYERLENRLQSAIAASRVADFVSVDFDHALAPGEARLEWRGGDIRRGRAEISAAIAALFDPITATEPRS